MGKKQVRAKKVGRIGAIIEKYTPVEDIVSAIYKKGTMTYDDFKALCSNARGCSTFKRSSDIPPYLEKNEIIERYQTVRRGSNHLSDYIRLTKDAIIYCEKTRA